MNATDLIVTLIYLAVFGAVTVFLFLVGRAIVLWYFRINEIVDLLHFINIKLGNDAGQSSAVPPK